MLDSPQRTLVERYHNVIYAALGKYHMPAAEYYDVAAERLCLAARSFQGNPNKFFSYAFVAVSRALMAAVHHKHPHPADIDEMPIAGPDAFAEPEDKQYQADILRLCAPFMTPEELNAIKHVMAGEQSHTPSEASARDRALKKCRAYMHGKPIKVIPNLALTSKQRAGRDKKIIELRAHGYGYNAVADMCGVSGRLVRQVYTAAGKPQYRTSADYARLYGIDRSTVLRHAQASKIGYVWQVSSIKYHKPYPKFSTSYSEDEISFIRNHPFWTAAEIAKKIGRTANSIRIKKSRIQKTWASG